MTQPSSHRGDPRRSVPPMAVGAVAMMLLLSLTACQPETRVVRYNPMLASLPGAETGMQPVRQFSTDFDPTALAPEDLRQTLDDGSIRLQARTARHLMIHIVTTLDQGERDLFTEQVLSQHTRREYLVRGQDPGQAFDTLLERRQDIQDFFDQMPSGEFSPGVVVSYPAEGILRLTATGSFARELPWRCMDMTMERGSWRLVWFGRCPPPRR